MPSQEYDPLGVRPSSGTFWNPQPLLFSQKYCRYKWEVYWYKITTNRRRTAAQIGCCIAAFLSLQGLEARKAQRYKWGAYCGTDWRCVAVLFRQVVRGWGF